MSAKKKEIKSSADYGVNMKDLNDEKKSQILSEKFNQFQKEMLETLGLQIGIRLQEIKTDVSYGHQAMMVPVRPAPAQPSDKKNEPKANE